MSDTIKYRLRTAAFHNGHIMEAGSVVTLPPGLDGEGSPFERIDGSLSEPTVAATAPAALSAAAQARIEMLGARITAGDQTIESQRQDLERASQTIADLTTQLEAANARIMDLETAPKPAKK